MDKTLLKEINDYIVEFRNYTNSGDFTNAENIFNNEILTKIKKLRNFLQEQRGVSGAFLIINYISEDVDYVLTKNFDILAIDMQYNKNGNFIIINTTQVAEPYYFYLNKILNLTVEPTWIGNIIPKNFGSYEPKTFEEIRDEIITYLISKNPQYNLLLNSLTPEKYLIDIISAIYDKLNAYIDLAISQTRLDIAQGDHLEQLARIYLNYSPAFPKPATTNLYLGIPNKENISIIKNNIEILEENILPPTYIEDIEVQCTNLSEGATILYNQLVSDLGFAPEFPPPYLKEYEASETSNATNLEKFLKKIIEKIKENILNNRTDEDIVFNTVLNSNEYNFKLPINGLIDNENNSHIAYISIDNSYQYYKNGNYTLEIESSFPYEISAEGHNYLLTKGEMTLKSASSLFLVPSIKLNSIYLRIRYFGIENDERYIKINNIIQFLEKKSTIFDLIPYSKTSPIIGNKKYDILPEYRNYKGTHNTSVTTNFIREIELSEFTDKESIHISTNNPNIKVKLFDKYTFSNTLLSFISETSFSIEELKNTIYCYLDINRKGLARIIILDNPAGQIPETTLGITYRTHEGTKANQINLPSLSINNLIITLKDNSSPDKYIKYKLNNTALQHINYIFDKPDGGTNGDTEEDIRRFTNYLAIDKLPYYINRAINETDISFLLNILKEKFPILTSKFDLIERPYNTNNPPHFPDHPSHQQDRD